MDARQGLAAILRDAVLRTAPRDEVANSCPRSEAGDPATKDAYTGLEVENLNAWYAAARVLFDLTLRVGRGEAVALMGRNGAGKSTTIKTVIALMARRSGTVRFCGRDISRLPPYEIARLGIGFVPEDRRVFSDLTVAENLDVGRQPQRQFPDGKPAPPWTEERLYALFPNLAGMANRLGRQMSGGEQQMLAVARTLMGNPLLVLLDEPSEGVAPVIVERMANTILELKKAGLSVLLSEQNIHFAALVCDRAYVLEKGEVQWEGAMAELAGDTATQRALLSI
jgi:branched-chain amino acid transport system ATP-binding protein